MRRTLLLLLLPGGIFIAFFFLAPLVFILGESFVGADGSVTLQRYMDVFRDPQFYRIYLRTLKIGLIVTLLAVVISYPSAYIITNLPAGKKSVLMSLVILPLMTNPVARTFA